MLIRIPRSWEISERLATPEDVYSNRRAFIKRLGGAGIGMIALSGLSAAGAFAEEKKDSDKEAPVKEGNKEALGGTDDPSTKPKLYPAKRNPAFGEVSVGRKLTPELYALGYNNFYEFSYRKEDVARNATKFKTEPWKVEITGLVKKPRTLDLDDILKMVALEERLYRFRCVEAWAMTVPWTGIPMKQFIEKVEPLGSAKYVRMETFLRLDEAPNQKDRRWPWPYYEGLSMEEATNELTLLATGLYGKPLAKQNGAPIRLVVPWKYGFKSIKSIVKIEFTDKKPETFWNTVGPNEYSFLANVEPTVPHPRWSQASERLIETGKRVPTQLYNGYQAQVAALYGKSL
jgi:sulfoxide reductase catalytic subunit YedY